MSDNFSKMETSAPFNMAIATLMSLRDTLNHIRDVEAKIEFHPAERQRIKIELVKRFYVDSAPLIMDDKIIERYKKILDIEPVEVMKVNRDQTKKRLTTKYSFILNKKLDEYLLKLQVELQKKKYYMPPTMDLGSAGLRMN